MIWLMEILKTQLEQLLIILHDKASNIAKNAKYDRYQCGLALVVYKFFYKKTSSNGIKNENMSDQ